MTQQTRPVQRLINRDWFSYLHMRFLNDLRGIKQSQGEWNLVDQFFLNEKNGPIKSKEGAD